MASWPTSLPAPYSPYSIETGDPIARTDMDSGPARTRRRSTSIPDRVSLSFLFDDAQMATFRAFWESDFMHGAAWVLMPVKTGRVAGMVMKDCRPTSGVFKAHPEGNTHWVVGFDAEVRNA